MRGHVYMRGGAECYVMRYLVAMISTLRSPLRVTLFSLTLIGLLSQPPTAVATGARDWDAGGGGVLGVPPTSRGPLTSARRAVALV